MPPPPRISRSRRSTAGVTSARESLRTGIACSTWCRRFVSSASRENTVISTCGRSLRSWATIDCRIASSPRLSPPYEPVIPTLYTSLPMLSRARASKISSCWRAWLLHPEDRIPRLFSFQYADHLFRGTPLAAARGLDRGTADMRGKDHIVEPEQRMVLARRLHLHDVDRRAGDALFHQRAMERLLVHHAAAREVHQIGGAPHKRELALSDHVVRLAVVGAVQRHEVGGAHELLEADPPAAERGHWRGRDVRVMHDQRHLERARPQRHARSDVAHADDA